MPAPYRDDAILVPRLAVARQVIDRLNATLSEAGLGSPLREPDPAEDVGAEVVAIPVAGVDPAAVRDALRGAPEPGPEVTLDFQYRVGTVEQDARERSLYMAAGKPSGHGTVAWLSAPRYAMGEPPPRGAVTDRPVVAVLDTPIWYHDWFDEFWANLELRGPASRSNSPEENDNEFGSHFGHGTFIAGLIRRYAPDALVRCVPVMDKHGHVNESDVARALTELGRRKANGERLDVVLMAFGRHSDSPDEDLLHVRSAIRALADKGVTFVASAGNDGGDAPVYPAAFAEEKGLRVVSVGAGTSRDEPAPYSSHGDWVSAWEDGTNVVSTMPLVTHEKAGHGYAWWSGTSFAAAIRAAKVATGEPESRAMAGP